LPPEKFDTERAISSSTYCHLVGSRQAITRAIADQRAAPRSVCRLHLYGNHLPIKKTTKFSVRVSADKPTEEEIAERHGDDDRKNFVSSPKSVPNCDILGNFPIRVRRRIHPWVR